jgi:hypothetical protein
MCGLFLQYISKRNTVTVAMHQYQSSLPEQHSSIEHFRKDFSLSWWFTLDVGSAIGSLHVMGGAVLQIFPKYMLPPIFRVRVSWVSKC